MDIVANATVTCGRSAPARAPPPLALASCLTQNSSWPCLATLQDKAQLQLRIKERT